MGTGEMLERQSYNNSVCHLQFELKATSPSSMLLPSVYVKVTYGLNIWVQDIFPAPELHY